MPFSAGFERKEEGSGGRKAKVQLPAVQDTPRKTVGVRLS
jgi:hypothetical protein